MSTEIEIAGVRMRIEFRLPDTAKHFLNFITRENCEDWDVRVRNEDLLRFASICSDGVLTPDSEAYILMAHASSVLLPFARVMFHGVSFLWRGKAWLLTAPSGTGKTTQLRHWQRLWPEDIGVINGDKSVLAREEDGSFRVYPSPWTGKEKDAGDLSGPLGGIVVLQQADHNAIRRLEPGESVLRIFEQFLILDDSLDVLRAAGEMEASLLEKIPVWLLDNLGDEASARLTYAALSDYEAMMNEDL